ncbi:amino acid/polyamine transporter I [Rhizophagus irregularis DAOM 181602=DAOM 197198]|nr:amino acid/polyamine transporter I [Rhizophagus irregularis DAOM 181602=DAOM 197198]
MSIPTQENMAQMERETNQVIEPSLSSPSKLSLIDDQLNSQNELLGVVYGIGMNVNNVIGSGIVTSPGIIWKAVKSPGIVLLLWIIGGIVSMSGSLSYVELGVIHKISGGETKYLQTAYPTPKNMMSYLFSFMFIFAIRPGLISAVLQSAAQYFWFTIKGYRYDQDILEQDTSGWNLPFSPFWSIKLMAVALLFIITLYHMLSNKWANYINQTLAVIKLTTYSIIALAGIVKLISNWPESKRNWQTPITGTTDVKDYSTSILLIMFSYNGWNSLNYSLDEFRKTEKKLIFSNSISVGIVIVVYILVNIAFISVVPEDYIVKNKINETIAATFFSILFGESIETSNNTVARIFTGLIVLSVMGTAAADIWSGSRVIVAAAKSNFFPIYSYELRSWNYYFNTPINALLAQFVWCTLIIFFVGSSFTLTSFTLFSTFSMYSYWIFYFATGIGLLLIRRRNSKNKGYHDEESSLNTNNNNNDKLYKVPLFVAIIFILAGLFILTFSFVVNDKCPIEIQLDTTTSCDDYSKKQRIQKLSPILMSYGFFFIAITFWYFLYYWWNTYKREKSRKLSFESEKNLELDVRDFDDHNNYDKNEKDDKDDVDKDDEFKRPSRPSNNSISQFGNNYSQHSLSQQSSLNRKNRNNNNLSIQP